jgi:hypothetical protein
MSAVGHSVILTIPQGSSGYTPFRLADVSWTLRISPWCTVAT